MILLDTNVFSELMKPKPNTQVLNWIDQHYEKDVFISSITKAEIELGIALLPLGKRQNELQKLANVLFLTFSGRCLSFDEQSATQYAKTVAQRKKIGRPISIEDAQIAAIALSNQGLLATRNTKDFEAIEGLRQINPWQM